MPVRECAGTGAGISMADLVNLTIDGKAVSAPAGTLVINAAKQAGIEVPAFCYYDGLSLQAACRMCLVEVEKTPKLQVGCTLPVAEGMIVHTDSPVVHEARRGTLEFLVDESSAPRLPRLRQRRRVRIAGHDVPLRYGAGEKPVSSSRKLHVDEQQWSPVVFFDNPRCILCYRCVRICNEGMGVGALGVGNRGVAISEIIPNHHDHLECDECGMCIDICPVGAALTSGTYRYKNAAVGDAARGHRFARIARMAAKPRSASATMKLFAATIGIAPASTASSFASGRGRYAFDFAHHPERLQSPLVRKNGKLEEVAWSEALELVARRFQEIKKRDGKFGVIGSNHTTNEENYYLQKFARQALGTNNIDHHRTGDVATLLDALSGSKTATRWRRPAISTSAKRSWLSRTISSQQLHPFLAFQIRANFRHHGAHIYTVTPGPVREAKPIAVKSVIAEPGGEIAALDSLRDALKAEPELVILFGDAVKGGAVRQLVAFGDSLGIPVKYIALVDYSNSRGALDMGVLPDLGPGYHGVEQTGLSYDQILSATDLDAVWVVGANPLKRATLAATKAFVVAHDLFLTETAQRADVVFPAASAYEKTGTVTNGCGEVQRLKHAIKVMGTKSDLEIMGLLSKEMGVQLGIWSPDKVFDEIRKTVRGYNIPLPVVTAGGAAQTTPVNGCGCLPHCGRI